MRIVQIAPDLLPIPGSGGIERIVYNLTEELVRRGHEVYVYALGKSRSSAVVIPYRHRCPHHVPLKEFVLQTLPDAVDVIHDHTHGLEIGRLHLSIPTLSTIHTEGGLNAPVQYPVFVSRTKLNQSDHRDRGVFVYNGIVLDNYEFSTEKDDFLLFLGRIDREKGVGSAVQVGVQTGMRTIIAGPVMDRNLYAELSPIICKYPNIEYVGEVHGKKKQALLKRAKWLLFPTACEEQFGLVIIEALACGTPVAAFSRGAVPEVLEKFPQLLCSNLDDMVRMIREGPRPKPEACRDYVARRFTSAFMADRYVELYERLLNGVWNA